MSYSVEFQLAGFIIVLIISHIFFSKPRLKSQQNMVFRDMLFLTLLELAFDIISVITIDKREELPPFVNTFFAKGYILIMQSWIAYCAFYALSNFARGEDLKSPRVRVLRIASYFIFVPLFVCWVISIATPLHYAGHGRDLYSYGIPSTCTYIFSTYSVVFIIIASFLNKDYVPFQRNVPVLTFVVMQGSVAIVQMYFPHLLIVGMGTAICILIMYLLLENPDVELLAKVDAANKRADDLLLRVFPARFGQKVKDNPNCISETYSDGAVAFMNIVGFSDMFGSFGMEKLLAILDMLVKEADDLVEKFRLEKVQTLGDIYMLSAGIPEAHEDDCEEMIRFFLAIQRLVQDFNTRNGTLFRVRIGAACGPMVAGVVGRLRRSYDLWGTTVHLAAKLELSGVTGKVQVSAEMYERLKDRYHFTPHTVLIPGKNTEYTAYLLDEDGSYTPPRYIPREASDQA